MSELITLAVETSSSLGSVALISGDASQQTLLGLKAWRRKKSHSEFITVAVKECLKSAEVSLDEINFFSVGQGPGSFTGIRVGINLVRSLAYAYSRPVFVANSLRVLAEPGLEFGAPVLCLVNAFKNMMYCAAYEALDDGQVAERISPRAVKAEELDQLIDQTYVCVGDAFPLFKSRISSQTLNHLRQPKRLPPAPSAHWLGILALQDQSPSAQQSWEFAKPLYIRASEAEEKLRGGLLKPLPKLF